MSAPLWLSILKPVECRLEPLMRGSDMLAWHATLAFTRWSLPQGASKLPWSVTYGKTQIARDDGTWTVAEIELVRRLRDAGWRAGWVDTFGSAPHLWTEWLVKPNSLPLPMRASYEAITRAAGSTGGGKPDIVAWQGESLADAVFVEYKGPNDKVLPGQDIWFRAALRNGMSRDQFAVAKWPKLARPHRSRSAPSAA
jgi:VRR-NUC domain